MQVYMKTNEHDSDMVEIYSKIGTKFYYLLCVAHKDSFSDMPTNYGDNENYLDDGVMVDLILNPTAPLPVKRGNKLIDSGG